MYHIKASEWNKKMKYSHRLKQFSYGFVTFTYETIKALQFTQNRFYVTCGVIIEFFYIHLFTNVSEGSFSYFPYC